MIYTSRYQNPELATGRYTVVGITRGKPKFPLKYELAGNIIEMPRPATCSMSTIGAGSHLATSSTWIGKERER